MARRAQPFYDAFTGRGVSERTALARVATYQIQREIAADRYTYAFDRLQTARAGASERYWMRETARTLAEVRGLDAALEVFAAQAEAVWPAPVEGPQVVREAPEGVPDALVPYWYDGGDFPSAFDVLLDDVAEEWEFGEDYDPNDGR